MKPTINRYTKLFPLLSSAFSITLIATASAETIYFLDTFDNAGTPTTINGNVPTRQSGDALPVGGAFYFHSAAASGRQQPSIVSDKFNLDGLTGNDGAGGTTSPATVNLDYMLVRNTNAGEGATTDGLDFGPSVAGTHYTVSVDVLVTANQNVDTLGIRWGDTPNFVGGANGTYISALATKTLNSGPVKAGINGDAAIANYLPSSGGGAIPGATPTTHHFDIDVDETVSPAIITVYENSDGTPKEIFSSTVTYVGGRPGRYLAIYGAGNVGGNTIGTIDNLTVKESTFAAAAIPKIWTGVNDEFWDIDTTENWTEDGVSATYLDGDDVIFDATGTQEVDIQETVAPASIVVSSANPLRFYTTASGSIAGATNYIQKSGNGNLRVELANTYAGGTTLTGGSVTATVNGALGTGLINLNGSTLNFESPETPLDFSNQIIGSNSVVTGKMVLLNPDGFDPEIDPGDGTQVTLSGAGNNEATVATVNASTKLILAKTTSGPVSAVGISSSTIPALTIESEGVVQLDGTGGNQIDDAGYVVNEGLFDLNGRNESVRWMEGFGVVDNTAAATTSELLFAGAEDFTFSGTIQNSVGTVSIKKNGVGVMTIDEAQTYTGVTTIGGGTLLIDGTGDISSTSQINVQTAGSVLDVSANGLVLTSPTSLINGVGSIIGNVTTPGNINPGINNNPTADIDITGNLTLPGTFTVNIDDRKDDPVTATADAVLDAGAITAINVTDGGQVYNTAPAVTITGDGTGATATASIVNGVVSAITVTNGGSGYSAATVTIAAATASAVTDTLTVSGDLNLTGATLVLNQAVPATGFPYTIMTYGGSLTGAFANVPSGFDVDYGTSGEIRLIEAVAGAGYADWAGASGFNLSGGAGDDDDNDGIDNAAEYVMGLDPTQPSQSTVTGSVTGGNLVFSFTRDQDSKTPDTSVTIEVGTTLAAWPDSYPVPDSGTLGPVTVADNLDGTDTVTLTVAAAPDTMKFGRLKVVVTP